MSDRRIGFSATCPKGHTYMQVFSVAERERLGRQDARLVARCGL